MKEKIYVRLWSAGLFVSNQDIVEIEKESDAESKLERYHYGYCTFKRTYEMVGKEILLGEIRDTSHTVYFGNKWTLKEVKEKMSDSKTLIGNMEGNDWPTVVECKQGFLPVLKKDIVKEIKEHPKYKDE